MTEISLPKQLSGTEALESMLAEVRRTLSLNGRFHSHMAYSGYRAEVQIRFYPAASFIPPIEQDVIVEKVPEGATLSEKATVEGTVEIPLRPPNQVREDADMPTPVLTQDEQGNPVERWVKRKGRMPKNRPVGGNVGPEPAITMVPTAIASTATGAASEGLHFAEKK